MKLTTKQVKKLLKEYTPKELINMYCLLKIDLYVKDLNMLIELKNKKEEINETRKYVTK